MTGPRLSMMDRNDVITRYCCRCGRPSLDGLCAKCAAPAPRRNFRVQEEPRDPGLPKNWWRAARNGLQRRCDCADCVARRTKVYTPPARFRPPFGREET